MSTVEDAKRILTVERLNLPSAPKIVQIDVEPYIDADCEDALAVWLILDEDTQDDELNGGNIWSIQEAIMDRLKEEGIGLFPYFRIAKQSELDELATERERGA